MKRAIELLGHVEDDDIGCDSPDCELCRDCEHCEPCNCLIDVLAKRAREEMRREACQAAIDAAADGFHDQSASDCADRVVAAIRALPVE